MNDDTLSKKLEEMHAPQVNAPAHQKQIKLALLNTSRSSRLGVLLVALPCTFVFAIFLKYQLRFRIDALTAFEEWMSKIDHTAFWFVVPLLLVGAPLLALALNVLALMHLQVDRVRRELQMSVKLKLANLIICAVSVMILAAVFVHVIGERG